ncbi:DNA polymerase Y family protein [Paractinoplanes abujensis]|uniref:DNA polymerase-4 n=1 Tax=Paractinoplanes abujensis TaxID=882441 RepID=A0A7W7CTJ1_9ACTN|nr:DNA polymerase IV [Actinoplanes abujensis]MBB4693018.1 DNA polymerase-4 [Actinoplanes abujensis]
MSRGPLLHADADAFFASVVLRSRPHLAALPVAVVAHVVVASANYPARARGVRAGVLAQQALLQCPGLILVDVPQDEVEEAGEALLDLFRDCARAVEPGSMEEAFLDVGARSPEEAVAAGHEVRRRAAAELAIPVSVGVGRTKLMAKLASRAAKPDGLHVIGPGREAELRAALPLRDVWGVGARTVERLESLGITTLAGLDDIPYETLRRLCGTAMARRLRAVREGSDDAVVRPVERRSTLSSEGATKGYARPDRTAAELAEMCVERVCRRAERAGLLASGLTLTALPEGEGPARVLKGSRPAPTANPRAWSGVVRALLARSEVPPLAGLRVTLTALVPADRVQDTLF